MRKIQKSPVAAKRKSLVHEHGKGNKPQAAQAIDEDEEDAFLEKENSANPIELRFKELCSGYYPHTSTLRFPSKRISVERSVVYGCFSTSRFAA